MSESDKASLSENGLDPGLITKQIDELKKNWGMLSVLQSTASPHQQRKAMAPAMEEVRN